MKTLFRLISVCMVLVLAACGGNTDVAPASVQAKRLAGPAKQGAAPATATLPGNRSQYVVAASNGNFLATDILTGQVTTYAAGTRVRMADAAVAFDLEGPPGQAFRIYQAAFDRAPDLAGLGFYISVLDGANLSLDVIAQSFIDSPEFAEKYGNLDNAAFLTMWYNNVLKRVPDQAGYDWNLSYLDGTNPDRIVVTRAQMLKFFSESPENKELVAPATRNGITYLPWGMAAPATPLAELAGTYGGNFGGADSGPVTLAVDAAGNIVLSGQSLGLQVTMTGAGKMQVGGKFTATLSGGGRTINFIGSVNVQAGNATGTWTLAPGSGSGTLVALKASPPTPTVQFAQVKAIIAQRCATCHAAKPSDALYSSAPLGILFDTEAQIRARADQIRATAVDSTFMPYLNRTGMTQAERDTLRSWFDAGKP